MQAEAVRFYVIIFVTIGGELSVEGCVMWRGCVVVRQKAFVLRGFTGGSGLRRWCVLQPLCSKAQAIWKWVASICCLAWYDNKLPGLVGCLVG